MSAGRPPDEQARHDLAVRRIRRACFGGSPHWEVYTNPGDAENYALVLPGGARVYPDIVARRQGAQVSSHLAEVETESTVTAAESEQWEQFASLGRRFILFVPAGCLLQARELCHERRIAVHGYRVYELTPFWIRVREFPV